MTTPLIPCTNARRIPIYACSSAAEVDIQNCTFEDNASKGPGGAVSLDQTAGSTRLYIEQCIFNQ